MLLLASNQLYEIIKYSVAGMAVLGTIILLVSQLMNKTPIDKSKEIQNKIKKL